jgi:hypothetical protein
MACTSFCCKRFQACRKQSTDADLPKKKPTKFSTEVVKPCAPRLGASAVLPEAAVAQGSQETGRLMISIAHWVYTMRVCTQQ